MTSLGKIYSDKETRGGIVVNKGYQVPVDQLYLEPGYNIREADEQHVEYFAQCWESGQPIPALTVIPDAGGKRIKILDGQHRYLGALRAIERGVPIARIECKDFTGDEADKIAFMVSSSQGKQLDPLERAKAYVRLKGFGWTNEEIAKKVGRSVSDVQMHLHLVMYLMPSSSASMQDKSAMPTPLQSHVSMAMMPLTLLMLPLRKQKHRARTR